MAELLPQSIQSMPEPNLQTPDIPDKLYFRIGEVASLVGVKQHVLRFWEEEFPGLSPKKSGTGQRLYRRKDVELLLKIKELLHTQRFTIEGARKHLAAVAAEAKARQPKVKGKAASMKGRVTPMPSAAPVPRQDSLFGYGPNPEVLAEIRTELQSILDLLHQR